MVGEADIYHQHVSAGVKNLHAQLVGGCGGGSDNAKLHIIYLQRLAKLGVKCGFISYKILLLKSEVFVYALIHFPLDKTSGTGVWQDGCAVCRHVKIMPVKVSPP